MSASPSSPTTQIPRQQPKSAKQTIQQHPATQTVNTAATTINTNFQQQQQIVIDQIDKLTHELNVLNTLKDINLLPLLLDLIENLKSGKITVKDFDNSAGRIRVRLNKFKSLVNELEGLNESTESRINRMNELKLKMEAKKQVLSEFKRLVETRYS